MVEVKVCVGSSCHLRGSYPVVQTFQRLIQQNGLEDVVHLHASFCLGCCVNGIATVVNDKPVNNVGILNAEQIFNEEILPLAQKELEEAAQ